MAPSSFLRLVTVGALAVAVAACAPVGQTPSSVREPAVTGRVADAFDAAPDAQDPGPSMAAATEVLHRLRVPDGYATSVFAHGLAKPRQLIFSPGGTALISDLERGEIYALPDRDGDGRADARYTVLTRLDFPNSLALHRGLLYVAVKDGVYRSRYDEKNFTATAPEKIVPLPVRRDIRHQTRTVAVGPDERLYIAVSSTCDACVEDDVRYAAILRANLDGADAKIFAQGLRNTVYFAFDSAGRLWGNDMGQDDLGADLPPDELNLVRENRHYGWPHCYGHRVIGTVASSTLACQDTEPPAYAYTAHVAPLGLAFIRSPQFPAAWQGDAVVALHGSWDIAPPVGYKVVRLEISGTRVAVEHDLITGWLEYVPGQNAAATSPGRPAYVAFDAAGALYVVDDKAGAVFRVSRTMP